MPLEVLYQPHTDNVVLAARRALEHALDQTVPVLLLSSGGSCLQLLREPLRLPSDLILSTVDERWTTNASDSNILQLLRTPVAQQVADTAGTVLSTLPEGTETVEAGAIRIEQQLREWRDRHQSGRIIATLGIGADGHTAGILPELEHPDQFHERFEQERWVCGYKAYGQHRVRVTTTYTFLRTQVDHAIVLVLGPEKARALSLALAPQGNLAATPARVLGELRHVELFTDQLVDGS